MQLVTWNVLGGLVLVRSQESLDYLRSLNADFVCLQEIRTHKTEIHDQIVRALARMPYYHFFDSNKPGCHGVALFSTRKPLGCVELLTEFPGRCIAFEYASYVVCSVYSPYSGLDQVNRTTRLNWETGLRNQLVELAGDREIVVAGDLNVAPDEEDRHKVTSAWPGCFSYESKAYYALLRRTKLVDSYRSLYSTGGYTWGRHGSKLRLDYILHSTTMRTLSARVDPRLHSDHSPLVVTLCSSSS